MSRELDARVATALGLDVVGEGWAYPDPEEDYWHPTSDGHSGMEMQPLFVAHCMCKLRANEGIDEWTPPKMLGHYPGCLEVVAFYSEDWGAMQQIVQAVRCGTVEGHVAGVIEMTISDVPLKDDCSCHIYGPSLARGGGRAGELPEAVALAFLAAMGK